MPVCFVPAVFLCLRVDSVNNGLGVLEESCLVPFLQQLLENDSLLDVDRHAALYTSVFKVVVVDGVRVRVRVGARVWVWVEEWVGVVVVVVGL